MLDVDIDFLLGATDTPSNEVDFISEHTGLTAENVKKLKSYSSELREDNYPRIFAINLILSSEKGLQILEAMANYILTNPETLMVATRDGTESARVYSLIVPSAVSTITISKEDIPAMYLTSITKLLTEWKDSL